MADTTITKTFNTPDMSGWSDPVNAAVTTMTAGSVIPSDIPALAIPPDTAPGFNGTPFLCLGRPDGDNYGVGLAVYDAVAQGDIATTPTDCVVEADVFIIIVPTLRHQEGVGGRWTAANGNLPFELFYSENTPGQPNGYGTRGGGSTTAYGRFGGVTESSSRWVHMKIVLNGAMADIYVDRNMDGIYELSETGIALTATEGMPVLFSVINDPSNGNVGVPTQYSYFDNLILYVPSPLGISDWMLHS
ncbi:MAG: hypothetical protein WCK47_10125 [bacterium]|nr:hypothetical protein [Candidatus Sumerlaeota bacterium]